MQLKYLYVVILLAISLKTASEEVSRLIDRGEKLNLSVDMERQGSYDKGYRAYYELTIYVLNDEKL